MARIPSLDGIRAIAVALVLACHLGNDHGIPDYFNAGDLGVRIFFVISGFLITGILLNEFDRTGSINLPRFYFRRTLRIFPPFYVFLGAMLVAGAIGWNTLTFQGALPALTYSSNYWVLWSESGYVTSHTWSLSTEEQFYLLWPPILWLSGRARAPYVLATLVTLSPILRTWIYFRAGMPTEDLAAFHFNVDHIGMGCLLAFWRDRLHASAGYLRALGSPLFVTVPIFIMVAACQGNHPSVYRTILPFVINVSIALCIDWAVTHHQSRIGRELNRPWIVWIGALSYSLYLWQQPFLHFRGNPPALNFAQLNPILALACILACAMASYYFVEKPALRLRDRGERVWKRVGWLPSTQPRSKTWECYRSQETIGRCRGVGDREDADWS